MNQYVKAHTRKPIYPLLTHIYDALDGFCTTERGSEESIQEYNNIKIPGYNTDGSDLETNLLQPIEVNNFIYIIPESEEERQIDKHTYVVRYKYNNKEMMSSFRDREDFLSHIYIIDIVWQ